MNKFNTSLRTSFQWNIGLALQVTQLKYRLSEGNGECFYYIGQHHCSLRPLLIHLLELQRQMQTFATTHGCRITWYHTCGVSGLGASCRWAPVTQLLTPTKQRSLSTVIISNKAKIFKIS